MTWLELGVFTPPQTETRVYAMLNYKETPEEELEPFRNKEDMLVLPSCDALSREALALDVSANTLLATHGRLLASLEIYCGWKDGNGDLCMGDVAIEVHFAGPYYQCKSDKKHRTPA